MVDKLKKIKTKQIVMFSVLAFMLVLVVGTTYAYFTAKVIGNDEAKDNQVYAGIMSLKLDGTQELKASNMLPGATKEVEFSVENTGTLTTTYELDMKEVYNDFSPKTELVYTLEQDGNIITAETEAPSIDEILIPAVVIEPNEKQTYKLKLTFKETGKDQNTNQNKTFTGKIQISGIDSSNYLQAKVLARSINTNEPDLKSADPATISKSTLTKNRIKVVNSSLTGNRAIGDGYAFNEKTGVYTLINVKINQTFNKSTIGKYACDNNIGSCREMYKILEVEESDSSVNFTSIIYINENISYASKENKVISDNYHFDQETGYYILDNPSELKSYDQSDIGKYTCNNTTSKCTKMYKINSVTDTTVTNVDTYTLWGHYNSIVKEDEYSSVKTNKIYSKSGVYKTNDDEGESYYFRGKIDNNYVSFANNLWRIVRINGDGSIRLVRQAITTKFSRFNGIFGEEKSAGYTYDNESNCTKENPCISDYDNEIQRFINNRKLSDSEMKAFLEDWYVNNLKDYNDKIVLGDYCNDTSITGINELEHYIYYGAYERIENKQQPSLKCPNTSVNYGGNYKLKIGLLSADEMTYAGLIYTYIERYALFDGSTDLNFLSNGNNGKYFSITPLKYYTYNFEYTAHIFSPFNNANLISYDFSGNTSYVRPVINLKSDIQITSGDGSKSDPYVVE